MEKGNCKRRTVTATQFTQNYKAYVIRSTIMKYMGPLSTRIEADSVETGQKMIKLRIQNVLTSISNQQRRHKTRTQSLKHNDYLTLIICNLQ